MNILVTGGCGGVGNGVVRRLVQNGHSVRVIDLKIGGEQIPGADYHTCDVTNYPALREHARGMQGIIHLAAFAYPAAAPGPEIFRVNCGATYNVFEAAAAEGIQKITCASSINALGFNFGVRPFPIQYFPIDEEHPIYTTDPYSFSKETTESIARYYWRRDGISSTCLRMPFVYTWDEQFAAMSAGFISHYHRAMQEFLNLPLAEQAHKREAMLAHLNQQRAERAWEKPYEQEEDGMELNTFDPSFLTSLGYTDFWSIVSVEDTAQAFEKSLLAEYQGSHPLLISEAENSTGQESEALLRAFFPEVTERRKAIPGKTTLVSFERASALIGYTPEFSIQNRK